MATNDAHISVGSKAGICQIMQSGIKVQAIARLV